MPDALMLTVASTVAPSLNCTVPVAVFAPEVLGVTVAVKVTNCPTFAGFSDEVSAVAVVASDELIV